MEPIAFDAPRETSESVGAYGSDLATGITPAARLAISSNDLLSRTNAKILAVVNYDYELPLIGL